MAVDLDVDSDNNNAMGNPDRLDAEDVIEDKQNDPDKPGKLLCVNDGDLDNDGAPNFADGFDKWSNEGSGAAGDFVPMILEIPDCVDLTEAKLRFEYSDSDPDGVTRTGTGTDADPYIYTPASGNLRIWNANGGTDRKKAEVSDEGNFVKSGSEYSPEDLGPGNTITLYVEGIGKSAGIADQRITVQLDPDGDGSIGYVCDDAVRCTVIQVDLDVDSDNDNAFGTPEEDANEDHREDMQGNPARPGKYVEINSDDDDHDCIPDFADGFDHDGIAGNVDDSCAQETFTPLVLEIKEPIDLSKAWLKITYSDSDPASTTRNGGEPLYSWTPASGKLRIWRKDGDQTRNKNSAGDAANPGDYVPEHTYDDLAKLGFSGSTRKVTFYVEGVAPASSPADEQIKVELDPDGDGPAAWVCLDGVRLTCVNTDLDVDSDNSDSMDECDDPIEAEEPGAILPKDLQGDGPDEDYLKEIKLKVEPVLSSGKVILSAGAGIKIWADASKTTEVSLPKEYNPPSSLPTSLYIDGITKGSKPDIELKYKDANDLEIASDKIRALVTETPSWAPAKADVAYVWSSLPSLGEDDGHEFENQIKDQGFTVVWYQDSTGSADCDFGSCTLANYRNMPNCGMFTVISHGGEGAHYAVYTEHTANGSAAMDSWIAGESNILKVEDAYGNYYSARVSSDWRASNWAATLNVNKSIALWSICYSATANTATGEAAVKEAAGGRWRSGYKDTTTMGEAKFVNKKFLERMNGTTDSAVKRTAGKAWDSGNGYQYYGVLNVKMDGDDWTTLCPSPMAEDEVFPSASPGQRYGWGCVIFDTYMNTTIPAAEALIKVTGGSTSDHKWISNTHGKFILGFDYDKTDGTATEMRAVGGKCTNADPDGGRPLDGNRVTPADKSSVGGAEDNKEWSY